MFDYGITNRTETPSSNNNCSDDQLQQHASKFASATPSLETNIPTNNNNDSNSNEDDEPASLDFFRSQGNNFINAASSAFGSKYFILILGQGISLLSASAGAAQATLHLDCNLSVPTLSTAFVYFSLTFLLIPFYYRERRKREHSPLQTLSRDQNGVLVDNDQQIPPESPPYSLFGIVPLSSPLWAYFCIAFLDVEANYVTVLAFQYTTLTSVNLFDALAIPSAMIFSKIILSRSYVKVHVIGATICMLGILVNVLNDYMYQNDERNDDISANNREDIEYPHRTVGDVLAISGGLMWGANNVIQEYAIRSCGIPLEFLGMLGLFGSLISIIQIVAFERDDITVFFSSNSEEDDTIATTPSCASGSQFLLILAYVGPCLGGYVGGTFFLLYSEAALFSLSMLTCDFWTVLFSVLVERIVPKPLFFVALVMIVTGVIVYEKGPSPILDLEYSWSSALESNSHDDGERSKEELDTSTRLDTNGGLQLIAASTELS